MQNTFKDKVNKKRADNQESANGNSKFPNVDDKLLLPQANIPNTFINQLPTLRFKKTGNKYVCVESGGLQIYRKQSSKSKYSASGDWYIKNNSNKLNVPEGDIWTFTKRLHGIEPKGNQAALFQLFTIIANAASLHVQDYCNSNVLKQVIKSGHVIETITKDWIVNEGQDLEVKYSYKITGYETPIGRAVSDYFDTWGISIETLKKYRIEPLIEAENINSKYDYVRRFTKESFAFAHIIGDSQTIKAKCPNSKNKIGKYFYIQNSGNYCFGYNQLPKTGKYLIIAAGEKDTLLINEHFEEYDISAICFASESANIDVKFLEQLKLRFEKIYTCFDNDKGGVMGMKKQANQHGIPYIDISEYTDLNDVSDIYKTKGLSHLTDIIGTEIKHKIAIAKRPNDPFSIAINSAYRIDIDRFIGEDVKNEDLGEKPLEILETHIFNHDRILLDAPTGTGKTWGLMYLSQKANFMELMDIERIIFCVPTTAIGDQLKADFKKEFNIDIGFIRGKSSDEDMEQAYRQSVVITTYDSLKKAVFGLDKTLLIVDEMHELRNAGNYRKGVVQSVFEYMNLAKKVVAVSATPLYQFCTNINERFNYKLCKVYSKNRQEIHIQPYVYSKGVEAFVLKHRLMNINQDESIGTHIYKKNDVNMLEAFKKTASTIYGEKHVTILSSKKAEYKDKNEHYHSIMNSGNIDRKVRFIFTTSLMDAGTSFKFPVDSCTMINPTCQDSTIQFLARARYMEKDLSKGIYETMNQKIMAFTYHTKGKPKKMDARQHTETIDALKMLIEIAENDTQKANDYVTQNKTFQSKYIDDLKYTYYSDVSGKWAVDYLAILLDEYTRQKEVDTIEDFYSRISHYQPHIRVLPIEKVDLLEDIRTHEELNAKREITKEQRKEALAHVVGCIEDKGNKMEMLLTSAYYCSDRRTQKAISETMINPLPKTPTSDVNCHIIDNASTFISGAIVKPIKRYLEIKDIGIKGNDIVKSMNMSDASYTVVKNSVVATNELRKYYESKNELSGKEKVRVEKYIKLIRAMKKINSKRREFTVDGLVKFVSSAYGEKTMTKERAIMRVKELFHVEVKKSRVQRNNRRNRATTYKILNARYRVSDKAK